MGRLQTSRLGKKETFLILALLLLIICIYAILHFLRGSMAVESVNFIEYSDPEMKANITSVGSGYYALISKRGKNFRIGILNESMLTELLSMVNSVLKEAEPIKLEDFNSTKANLTMHYKQRSKAFRGENLTLINDLIVEMYVFPNTTLIQIEAPKKTMYFRSPSLDLREFFGKLYNWSEYHTIRILNLTWIKLQEKGKLPYKYKIGSIWINQSSDKPIVITMIWQGCPCKFNPPETFQFSLAGVLGG